MGCESCEEKAKMKEIMNSFTKKENGERYNTIERMSKQLKSCIDDLLASGLDMRQNYVECTKLDMITDRKELIERLKKIEDLARMQTVNVNVLISTIEIILNQLQGYT